MPAPSNPPPPDLNDAIRCLVAYWGAIFMPEVVSYFVPVGVDAHGPLGVYIDLSEFCSFEHLTAIHHFLLQLAGEPLQ